MYVLSHCVSLTSPLSGAVIATADSAAVFALCLYWIAVVLFFRRGSVIFPSFSYHAHRRVVTALKNSCLRLLI